MVFVIVCEGGPLMLEVSGQHSLGPLRSGFRRCVAVNLEEHLDSGSWTLCISAVGKSGDLGVHVAIHVWLPLINIFNEREFLVKL